MIYYLKNNNPYSIICKESDGYINITNLCKASGRHFKTWNNRSRTKEFLKILGEHIKNEYQANNAVQKHAASFESLQLDSCVLINTEHIKNEYQQKEPGRFRYRQNLMYKCQSGSINYWLWERWV